MDALKTMKIDISMALKGAKGVQNELQAMLSAVPLLEKRFKELNIDDVFKPKLKKMIDDITKEFSKLENAIPKKGKSGSGHLDAGGYSGAEKDALLKQTYTEALGKLAELKIAMEGYNQVSKSAFSAQKEDIKKTVDLLESNQIHIKNLSALYEEARAKAKAANSTAPLAKFNQELEIRAKKLIKVNGLLKTMDTIGVNTEQGDKYKQDLQAIAKSLEDFTVPLKKTDTLLNGMKMSPKLLNDMQAFSKYSKGLGEELKTSLVGLSKTSQSYGKIKGLIEAISVEQQRVAEGGKEEFSIAKKNTKEVADRFATYQRLTAQADTLTNSLTINENVTKETAQATELVVRKLRAAAGNQLDLNKSSLEHNRVLKEALTFEALINKNMKEKVNTEKKLLALRAKTRAEIDNINRLMKSKASYATADALRDAKEEAIALTGFLAKIDTQLSSVRSVGTIDGKLDEASLSRVKNSAERLTEEFRSTNGQIRKVKTNLSEMSQIKWAGNILKRAAAYASMYASIYEVITLIRNGVGAVVEFDTQMRTIEAVFDVTGGTAKRLTQDLLGLGRAWGGSVTDINEAALALGRAGIATEKVTEATEVVIKMAKLTGDTIATSASAIITYQQVFGATHPVLKEVGDQLAYVANQSRLSTQDIGTFSNYALAAASAAGLSMEAINAMATSFSNAGVNASTIGTQIRRFSSLMRDNSTAATEFFLKLGTTQEAFSAQMQKGKKSADEALTWIASKLKNLSNSEFQKTISGMDILASNSITLLRNNADEFLRHFTTLNEGVRGEIDKANLISDGYQASFEKMKTSASSAFIELSETAAPVIQDMLDSMTKFFDYIRNNSASVTETLSTIVDVAKWTLMVGTMYGAVRAVSAVSTVLGGAGAVAIGVAAHMRGLASAFMLATAGVRAFLASNPIGWAILGATAIGSIALSMSDYGDEVGSVAEKTRKLNEANSQSEQVEQSLKSNRRELGQLMKVLSNSTHTATKAELDRAAALEMSIMKDEESIQAIRRRQQAQELAAQIKVGNNEIGIITQEIKLAEDDGNQALIGALVRRKERLQEKIGTIKIKLTFKEAREEYTVGVTDLMNEIVAKQRVLDELMSNGVVGEGLKQRTKELEALKAKLQSVYNVDTSKFSGGDLSAEIEKYLNTVQGKLDSAQLYLSMHPNIPEEGKAQLVTEIENLRTVLSDHGIKANDLFTAGFLEEITQFGNSIRNQLKAGMDIAPQMADFYNKFDEGMAKISASAQYNAVQLNQYLADAITSIDTNQVGEEFFTLMQRITEAEEAFSAADTAKDKAVAVSELKNVLSTLELKYKDVASEAINSTRTIVNYYDDLNLKTQALAGELAKTADAGLGSSKLIEKASKLVNTIEGMIAPAEDLHMTFADINGKMGTSIDLAWQIQGANLSAAEAGDLQASAKKTLIEMQMTLNQLAEAYVYIMNHAALVDAETKGALLVDLQGQMVAAINKATAAQKNFKAVSSKLTKIHSSHRTHTRAVARHAKDGARHARSGAAATRGAASSAKKYADELKRAKEEWKKLATAAEVANNGNMPKFKNDLSAQLAHIDEIGRKAKKTKAEIAQLSYSTLLGEEKKVDSSKSDANASILKDMGVESYGIQLEYQKRQQLLMEHYDKKEEILRQKETQLKTLIEQDGANPEYRQQLQDLELEQYQMHVQKKQAIDDAYYTNLAMRANAGISDALSVMEKLYATGLIKSKGWVRAMQALQVAKAIMTTYQNAVQAYAIGLETGGPFGMALGAGYASIAIASGMAQVAQIKQQKYHTGGYVAKPLSSGVGGLKDDEVSAVLKKGEYVLSDKEVASLKSQNRRRNGFPEDSKSKNGNSSDSKSLTARELTSIAEAMKSEVVIVNSQDPAVMEDWATSRAGREVIMNIVNQ